MLLAGVLLMADDKFESASGDTLFNSDPPYSFNFSSASRSMRITATAEPLSFLLAETGDFLVQEDGGKLILDEAA